MYAEWRMCAKYIYQDVQYVCGGIEHRNNKSYATEI